MFMTVLEVIGSLVAIALGVCVLAGAGFLLAVALAPVWRRALAVAAALAAVLVGLMAYSNL